MKKSNIVFTALGCLAMCAAAWSQTATPSTAADILRQARNYQFQFRTGHYGVVPQYVAMLEEATSADPGNADLWDAMGVAYLAQAAGTMLSGGKPADAMAAIEKGPQALERALKLNPDHPGALAIHGGVQAAMASLQQQPDLAAKGVAEMNRAVQLAPSSVRVRLQRAFSGINLPDALRNHTAEAEDLDFLIDVAGKSRPGDYLHILRGDLYFEFGQPDLGRNHYEIAGRSPSPAATLAQTRLTELSEGGIPVTAIKRLRTAAGTNCVMCHGR
jgi:hypothetical protein